jgi:pimeloyl-ACP methyl ester carboxylesterase
MTLLLLMFGKAATASASSSSSLFRLFLFSGLFKIQEGFPLLSSSSSLHDPPFYDTARRSSSNSRCPSSCSGTLFSGASHAVLLPLPVLLREPTVRFYACSSTSRSRGEQRMRSSTCPVLSLQQQEAAGAGGGGKGESVPRHRHHEEEEEDPYYEVVPQPLPVTRFWPSSRNDGISLAYQHLVWNDTDDDDADADAAADDTDNDDDSIKAKGKKNKTKTSKTITTTVVYLPGYNSNMGGIKSNAIWQWCCCSNNKCNMLRFDYTGHGQSSFGGCDSWPDDYGIATWLDDCLWMIESLVLQKRRTNNNNDTTTAAAAASTTGTDDDDDDDDTADHQQHSIVLVGASMGGWLAVLLLLQRSRSSSNRRRLPIAGILTIAAAPDFTEFIYNTRLSEQQRQQMQEMGHVDLLSRYSQDNAPYRYSHRLVLEGREHLLLSSSSSSSPSSLSKSDDKTSTSSLPSSSSSSSRLLKDDAYNDIDIPIALMHGTCDEDIPFSFSERLYQELCAKNNNNSNNKNNVRLHLVAGGDHRLSDAHHLDLITKHLDDIVRQVVIRSQRQQRR